MQRLIVAVVTTVLATVVLAGTKTWKGAAGGSWNVDGNWEGGLPAAGDTVVLNASSVNDIDGLSLASIQFAGSGKYDVSGNAVTVTGPTGIVVNAGVTVTNNLALTFSADTTWLVKNTGTLVQNESFNSGSHKLTVCSGVPTEMGTVCLLKANAISGQFYNEQGKVYVYHSQAFGTASVKNNQAQVNSADYGRFYFGNVTLANTFEIMDSNTDGNSASQVLNAIVNTTNTFTGKLTFKQSSMYATVPPSAKFIWAGGISMMNYFRAGYYKSAAGEIEFTTTPVSIKNLGYSGSYNGTGNARPNVRFSCTGNKITGEMRICTNGKVSFGVEDAIDVTSKGCFLNNMSGTVDLSGYSQHLRGFRNCYANNGEITSASAATLYMNQCDTYTLQSDCYESYGGQITGKASLSKYGEQKLTLGSNTSDVRTFKTSGYLEVTEGDLELNAKAIWKSGDVRVSGSGNLILNDSKNLPSNAVIRVTTNATSTAKITLNSVLAVAKVIVNGEELDEASYTKANLGGLLAGDGALVVKDPDRQPKTTTWIGAAGGNWSNAANWDNGKPMSGDSVVLMAASVNDIPGLMLAGLTYGGTGYTTSGEGIVLNGPLAVITEPGGDVGMTRIYTNDIAIISGGERTWTVGSTNTTLVLTQPVTSTGKLTCEGYGSLELRADNELTGGFSTMYTTVHAYRDASFSASGEGTVEVRRNAVGTLGRLWLHGVTLKNQVSETDHSDRRCGLVSAAGTTNVLQGLLYTESSIYPGIQTNSTLILEGGALSKNKNLFRPVGGYDSSWADDKALGDGNRTSWIIVRNKPLQDFQGLGYDEKCCVRFEVAGNVFTKNPQDATAKYSGVTIFGTPTLIETAVPYVFNYGDGNGPIRRLEGTLDLCGCDQRVGGFTYLDRSAGKITSDEPATLYLVQKLMQSNGSSNPAIKYLEQDIAGQVSISKAGTNATYLAKAKTSTGRLEVTEGDLVLNSNFSWAGTNVVVAGTNEVASMGSEIIPGNLRVNAKGNLSRKTVLSVYGNGTLTIAASVRATVAELWVDEGGTLFKQDPGDYTKGNCSFVKGDGVLHVRGGGVTLVVR